jgi:AcrR family transcriptional regulator
MYVNMEPMPSSVRAKKPRLFKGKSPEERRRERRERLVAAGLEAFGTRGFHTVGVRDICAEAQLTERYFYESFPNREALFLEVYRHATELVRAAIEQKVAEAPRDPRAVSRAGLRAFFGALRDEPRIARIILIDVLTISPDVGHQSRLTTESFAVLVGEITRGLVPALEKHGVDPSRIALGLVGSTIFLAMQWAFNGFRETLDDITDHAVLFYDAVTAEGLRRIAEDGP